MKEEDTSQIIVFRTKEKCQHNYLLGGISRIKLDRA